MPQATNSAVAVVQHLIGWAAAQQVVSAACAEAERLGVRVNVAVTDSGGSLVAFARMPGAFLHSIDIAIDKAYTAASFGFATGAWTHTLEDASPQLRDGLAARPRLVMFGGGYPIEHEGLRIGGIGVSGASEAQDEACARAGLAALAAGAAA